MASQRVASDFVVFLFLSIQCLISADVGYVPRISNFVEVYLFFKTNLFSASKSGYFPRLVFNNRFHVSCRLDEIGHDMSLKTLS